MKFRDFVTMNKEFAIVITPQEYRSIKDKLREFYTNEDLEDIDEFCRFEYSTGSFFLCNLRLKARIITPCMLGNAVTFVDRIMFRDVEFEERYQLKRFENMTDQELIDFCHVNMLDIKVCEALGCKELCKDEDCPMTQVLCRFEKHILSTKEEVK